MKRLLIGMFFVFSSCDQPPDSVETADCGTTSHTDAEVTHQDAQAVTPDATIDADLCLNVWAPPKPAWPRECGCTCGHLCAPDVPIIGDRAICLPRCTDARLHCAWERGEWCDKEFGGDDGVCRLASQRSDGGG